MEAMHLLVRYQKQLMTQSRKSKQNSVSYVLVTYDQYPKVNKKEPTNSYMCYWLCPKKYPEHKNLMSFLMVSEHAPPLLWLKILLLSFKTFKYKNVLKIWSSKICK